MSNQAEGNLEPWAIFEFWHSCSSIFSIYPLLTLTQKCKRLVSPRELSRLWRVSSCGIWRRVVRWVSTDVSEEHIAYIFRVEEISSAKKNSKQAGGKELHGVISQKMILFITTAVKTSNPTLSRLSEVWSHCLEDAIAYDSRLMRPHLQYRTQAEKRTVNILPHNSSFFAALNFSLNNIPGWAKSRRSKCAGINKQEHQANNVLIDTEL
jgi:hypothetical protein